MVVKGNPRDIDGLEPLFNLVLLALANIDKQACLEQRLLLALRKTCEVLHIAPAVFYGELARHEAPNRGNTLLPVEHL